MVDLRNVGFIVGVILLFIAAMMILPLGVSIYYLDGDTAAIGWSMAVTAVVGGALMLLRRKDRDIGIRDGFAVVSFGWLAMALAGALPFYLSGAVSSFTDCFFESMSGFTTTGASILGPHRPIELLPHGVLFWRSLTHWIGGMGIILLSLAILPMLKVGGMQLFRAEVPGPTKDKLTPRIRDTAEILWLVYVGISAMETLLLFIGGMDLFEAACHTFGTMATGGFSTRSESIAAFGSAYVEYVVIIFMFIAGTNFALHYRLLFRRQIGCYWRSGEFRLYLFLVALFTALMMGNNLGSGTVHGFEVAFRESLFQVVSILTTTGYGSADWGGWGAFAQVLLVLLMIVGGMAGSTGGGVKVMRFQVLLGQVRIELQRLIHPQAVLPLRISAFGAAIASLSNIGPGLGAVGPAENYGWLPNAAKWLLAMLMMLGRLEVFTVLVLFSRYFWRR